MSTIDPIEQYLQADVPLRVLLEHGAQSLDWLTELDASPIVLSYRDPSGDIVNEHVTKLGLIERAHALGWQPLEPGEAEIILFDDVIAWEDKATEDGSVAGIWFSHEHATHWETDAWGTPLGIPADRFAAIERHDRTKREESERMRAELEQREELLGTATLCDGLIEERIKGRLKRDGIKLSHSQAWEEVQTIAQKRRLDVFTDHKFPPYPWGPDAKRECRLMVHFWYDLHAGLPVDQCETAGDDDDI